MTPYATRLSLIERAHRNEEIWQAYHEGQSIRSLARDAGMSTWGVSRIILKLAARRYGRKFQTPEEVRNARMP